MLFIFTVEIPQNTPALGLGGVRDLGCLSSGDSGGGDTGGDSFQAGAAVALLGLGPYFLGTQDAQRLMRVKRVGLRVNKLKASAFKKKEALRVVDSNHKGRLTEPHPRDQLLRFLLS